MRSLQPSSAADDRVTVLPGADRGARTVWAFELDERVARRITSSPLLRRFVYGAAWSSFATAASRVFLLVAMIGVARILGREMHGRLGIVQNTVGMFGVFAGMGLGLATSKLVAQYRRAAPDRAGRVAACAQTVSVILSLIVAGICWCTAPWLAGQVLGDVALSEPLRIGGGLVVCGALNGATTGILSGLEAYRALAIVNTISGATALVLVVGGARWGGIHGAVWGLVITAAVQAALGQLALHRVAASERVAIDFARSWEETGTVFQIGLPAALSAITVLPVEWATSALLVNQPGGYGQMGLYSAAALWFNALQLIPASLGQALLPQMSERWGAGDRGGMWKLMLLGMATNLAVVLPLVAIGCCGSQWLMTRNGPEFADGARALQLLLAAMLAIALQTPVGNLLHASGRSWTSLLMNSAWALTYLCGAWWGVTAGAEGLAGARLAAYLAHTVWVLGFAVWILIRMQRNDATSSGST